MALNHTENNKNQWQLIEWASIIGLSQQSHQTYIYAHPYIVWGPHGFHLMYVVRFSEALFVKDLMIDQLHII